MTKQKFKRKRIPSTQRLPTAATRAQLLNEMEKMVKVFMRIVAMSSEDMTEKEKLADYFLFVLNILDIENEKLSYEKIECQGSKRNKRTVSEI